MAENRVFTVWDYVVFASMLLMSTAIGIFSALKRGRTGQGTTEQFLVGSRQISAYPIAFSLAASFMSAITMIGYPAEVYNTGLNVLLLNFTLLLTSIITCLIYIPLFYRLNIISTYEYINQRFGRVVRYQIVCSFMVYMFFYLGIATYTPSFALSQVTGMDMWTSVVITGLACTLYTTLGGIKAVVWTDVFQLCIMVIGLVAVLIQGSIHVGGFGKIWNIAKNGNRTDIFDFDPDPRKLYTTWSVGIGAVFGWVSIYGCNQVQVQRYLACKSEREAIKAVMLNSVGVIVLFTVSCLSGLVMYAVYETCDPIKMNRVSTSDQLTPLLVVDLFDQMPGFPGLFVASAYSGTLSTISSGISAMAAVAVEDFLKPIWKPWAQLSSRKKTLVSKLLAMTFGLTTIGLAGVSSLLGRNVVQTSLMFDGLILGPMLGVFTLAALFPKSNGKGACVGWFVGVAFSMWIGIGGLIYPRPREFSELLETSTAGCLEANATTSTPVNVTSMLTTLIPTKQEERPDIAENLYAISFYYYGPIGCLSTVLVGLIISMLTGGTENVDPCLIAPIVHTIYKYVFKDKLNSSIPETSDNLITTPVPKQSSKGCVDSPVLNPIKSTRL
ncbi:sodium-coupled monocarboxylate transporter 1-like [Scyliorhinus canicula]|uniref:sodium-coupled monocarboxylate transporter 1-like n=1 Tax=Scyliorhinus canicula TaxID=7830 RepID=UPI0018F3DB5B|nr:sodium-coupled monocarboxylate transporter 1-like [Scyliorhinus canicula]